MGRWHLLRPIGAVALADRARIGERGPVKRRRASAPLVSRSFAGSRFPPGIIESQVVQALYASWTSRLAANPDMGLVEYGT